MCDVSTKEREGERKLTTATKEELFLQERSNTKGLYKRQPNFVNYFRRAKSAGEKEEKKVHRSTGITKAFRNVKKGGKQVAS